MKKLPVCLCCIFALLCMLLSCKTVAEKAEPEKPTAAGTTVGDNQPAGKSETAVDGLSGNMPGTQAEESISQQLQTKIPKNADTFQISPQSGQETLKTITTNGITIKERSDYRTYINDKYSGLTYRETEIRLNQTGENEKHFSGKAFVLQDTRRNMVSQVRKADEVLDIRYLKDSSGHEEFTGDSGFPLLREFFDSLNLNYETMEVGTYWNSQAVIAAWPLKERGAVIMPVIVRYSYAGQANYLGEPINKVTAKYALRNNETLPFSSVSGTRDVEIFLRRSTNQVLFVREKTAENWVYSDGTKVKNEGTLLHFFTYSSTQSRITKDTQNRITKVEITDGQDANKPNPAPDKNSEMTEIIVPANDSYSVTTTDVGLQLRLKDLKFVADKAILLPGEEKKLDDIAAVLKQCTGKRFFVEGHTASTGRPSDEKILSEQRALTIVTELTARGISESLFIYSGAGSTKPIASNDTPQGMAENRRVEITVMNQ